MAVIISTYATQSSDEASISVSEENESRTDSSSDSPSRKSIFLAEETNDAEPFIQKSMKYSNICDLTKQQKTYISCLYACVSEVAEVYNREINMRLIGPISKQIVNQVRKYVKNEPFNFMSYMGAEIECENDENLRDITVKEITKKLNKIDFVAVTEDTRKAKTHHDIKITNFLLENTSIFNILPSNLNLNKLTTTVILNGILNSSIFKDTENAEKALLKPISAIINKLITEKMIQHEFRSIAEDIAEKMFEIIEEGIKGSLSLVIDRKVQPALNEPASDSSVKMVKRVSVETDVHQNRKKRRFSG